MKKHLQQRFTTKIEKLVQKIPILQIGIGMVVVGILLIAAPLLVRSYYHNKVYPNVTVAGYPMGGLNKNQVESALHKLTSTYMTQTDLTLKLPSEALTTTSSAQTLPSLTWEDIDLTFDISATTTNLFKTGRSGHLLSDLWTVWRLWQSPVDLPVVYSYNAQSLRDHVQNLSHLTLDSGRPAAITLHDTNPLKIEVDPGVDGYELNPAPAKDILDQQLAHLDHQAIPLLPQKISYQITTDQVSQTQQRAESLINKKLTLVVVEDNNRIKHTQTLTAQQLVELINPSNGYYPQQLHTLLAEIAAAVEQPASNAIFELTDNRVTNFNPGTTGISLPIEPNQRLVVSALNQLESGTAEESVNLLINKTSPQIALGDTNDLGIKELIGRGESYYRNSIPGRVHNVAHTASLLNGRLVPPGEVFSFNQAVGQINQATGFQTAYVIKDGRTVLGDGGGVCQDSTTLFRAVLDAGLEITQRRPHSYRVGYYEQGYDPGYDATVYAPSVDFKFRNDTENYVVVIARADSKNMHLVVDLYGASDGRIAQISNYKQWGFQDPPEPAYQDDPSLPVGTTKQVDWSASGLNVSFDYLVEKDGQILHQKTFTSNYRPWRAVYLVGTKTD